VLRPGGLIAVTVPRYGPELINWALSDEYHNVPGGHVRIYRRSTLRGRGAAGTRGRGIDNMVTREQPHDDRTYFLRAVSHRP
jgi:hypothetical protein